MSNWVLSTDQSIGGLSQGQWKYSSVSNRTKHDSEESAAVDNLPCAVFSGRLSMACEPTEAGVVRSGYCAVRAPRPKEVQLFGSQGLQMRVKTDGRIFRVNIQTEGWNPFDIHMGFIRAPPSKWVDIELPFSSLLLTSRGYVKMDDATVLYPSKLLNIGFAISDQEEGPFELRVQWIKAIADMEDACDERERLSIDDLEEDKPSLPRNRSPQQTQKTKGLAL
uniref:Uncharacterized protein AlNc14C9G1172 n=1 Tax=Albugo laibachii Nc14 TaxID=890382 RepID=F0W2C2_9STRA|nr:conserved hypothetical protein [Albugo laibachii Nc14]|eukprot:CCA15207.1 conserved hypothetical protein [Albugo laibachii Nc14]